MNLCVLYLLRRAEHAARARMYMCGACMRRALARVCRSVRACMRACMRTCVAYVRCIRVCGVCMPGPYGHRMLAWVRCKRQVVCSARPRMSVALVCDFGCVPLRACAWVHVCVACNACTCPSPSVERYVPRTRESTTCTSAATAKKAAFREGRYACSSLHTRHIEGRIPVWLYGTVLEK